VVARPSFQKVVHTADCTEAIDAFVERQQIIWLQRQDQLIEEGVANAICPPTTRERMVEELCRSNFLRLQQQQQQQQQQQPSPPPLVGQEAAQHCGSGGGPGGAALAVRGLTVLPASLGVAPTCFEEAERRLAAMTAGEIQAIFEPPSLHLLHLLCPWEIGLGAPPSSASAAVPVAPPHTEWKADGVEEPKPMLGSGERETSTRSGIDE
jgi:hypothetical protein